MAVSFQKNSPNNATLTVEIKKDDYAKKIEDSIKRVAKQVAMKGFRPGAAPLGLVKKMYGTSVLAEEVEKMLNGEVFGYLNDNKIEILGQPLPAASQELLDLDINNIKDISFSYELGLSPEVNFSYIDKKPTFTKYKVTVEDKMIDEEVDRLRKRSATYTYPETVEETDVLSVTIEELSGKDVKEGGVSNVTSVSPDMFKADFRNKVLALKKHESLEVNIFDVLDRSREDVIKHILGINEAEKATSIGNDFKITLNNITRAVPAELNAEFFDKIYGEGIVTSEAEMRERIKNDLEDYFNGQADSYLINDLYKTLMEKIELPLPDEFLKRWIKAANKDLSEEQIATDYEPFSKQIRWNLITKKIINEQNLFVSKEELRAKAEAEIMAQLYGYGMRDLGSDWIGQFVDKQLADKKYTEQLHERILDDKALLYVKTQVKLEDK
ncbi:MAG TPA: trigger factor, partial [Chitinophagales bacterium]